MRIRQLIIKHYHNLTTIPFANYKAFVLSNRCSTKARANSIDVPGPLLVMHLFETTTLSSILDLFLSLSTQLG